MSYSVTVHYMDGAPILQGPSVINSDLVSSSLVYADLGPSSAKQVLVSSVTHDKHRVEYSDLNLNAEPTLSKVEAVKCLHPAGWLGNTPTPHFSVCFISAYISEHVIASCFVHRLYTHTSSHQL